VENSLGKKLCGLHLYSNQCGINTRHFLNLLYLQMIFILFEGLDVPTPAPEEVARYTVRTMLRSVPAVVPGMEV
jgi:hypothetical protein